MLPLTLLATNKLSALLTTNDALSQAISTSATQAGVVIPVIRSNQVVRSSAPVEIAERELQLSYPRVCLYASQVKNSQREKFRSFSGAVAVTCEVWSSANLVGDADLAIHYYLDAISSILQKNKGDWGDGFTFSGVYDVQLQSPKVGGSGFLESAKLTCSLDVSLS